MHQLLFLPLLLCAFVARAEYLHRVIEDDEPDSDFSRFLLNNDDSDIGIDDFFRFMGIEEELLAIPINEDSLTELAVIVRAKLGLSPNETEPTIDTVGFDQFALYSRWKKIRENQAVDEYENNSTTSTTTTAIPTTTTTAIPTTTTIPTEPEPQDDHEVSKRLFRSAGRNRWADKAKNVFTKVGEVVKKGAVQAKKFLQRFFKKARKMFKKMRTKLSKQIARAKELYLKAKGSKFIKLMNETVSVVYNNMPDSVKDMIMDKAVDLVIGSEAEILEGMGALDFDPNDLGNDDDLDLELSDYEGFDDEGADDPLLKGISEADEALLKVGDDKEELRLLKNGDRKPRGKHAYQGACCCATVAGQTKSVDDLTLDDGEDSSLILHQDDEDTAGFFNVTMSDLNEESAEEDMKTNFEHMEDMGDEDYANDENFLAAITKRDVKPSCGCSTRGMMKREMVLQKRAVKAGVNKMPSLTSTMPEQGAIEMLIQANVTNGDEFCLKNKKDGCVSIDGVTLGGISGLIVTKVACPSCMFPLRGVLESKDNPFVRGWVFGIDRSNELDVFIHETFNTYDGHAEYYDGHKNRWSIVQDGGDDFHWQFYVHL